MQTQSGDARDEASTPPAPGPEEGAEQAAQAVWLNVDYPPLASAPVLGTTFDVHGWACGHEPIAAVEVRVDGVLVAEASHGYVRRDVRRAHPSLNGSGKSGFRAPVDLSAAEAGEHLIEVRARSLSGDEASVQGTVVVSETPPPVGLPGVPDWDAQWQRLCRRPGPTPAKIEAAAALSERLRTRFGLVVVVRDHEPRLVAETLASIRAQAHEGHETVVVDDGSDEPRLGPLLERAAAADRGLRIVRHAEPRGDARALAAGLAALGADFVSFVGAGDVLAPLALHALARRVSERPSTRVLYTDGDRVSPSGRRYHPAFLPDWSPHLLLATDYFHGLVAFERELVQATGGIDASLPGAYLHDLALRATERTDAVEHVAEALLSVRLARDRSRAALRPFRRSGMREAIERALVRRGIAGEVEATARDGVFRVRRRLEHEPLVSILMPTAATTHVGRAVRSLLERTRYGRYEVVVLDTSGGEPRVKALLASLVRLDPRVRVIEDPRRPFSFAATVNRGAEEARGEFLLPLNDDTEVLDPGWLEAMLGVAQDPRVGVVGARLLYPSGRIQHAGIVLGIGEIAGHAFRHFPAEHPGYLDLAVAEREVAGATFACALVRRSVWESLAGLDAVNLPLSYNDVDFCLRAREAGHAVVYTPWARLLHFESATRGGADASIGHVYIRRRFRAALARDPFYNPNLSLAGEDFALDLEGDDE